MENDYKSGSLKQKTKFNNQCEKKKKNLKSLRTEEKNNSVR